MSGSINKNDYKAAAAAAYGRIEKEPSVCGQVRKIISGQEFMEPVLRRGEQEKRGYIVLPGTGNRPFFVGDPPLWKENPVGDEEYVWGLNRHAYWKDFILCYCVTQDGAYLERIRMELADWIAECKRPELTEDPDEAREIFSNTEKGDPWRTLEAGIRMFDSWNYAIPALIQEGYMTQDEFYAAVQSMIQHGELLYAVAPLLWPGADHNHYIMENLGLLYAAGMLRELPESDEWARHACNELARCAKNQLTADGGQLEGSPSYHNICMEYFCKWFLMAKRLDIPVPEECRTLVRKGMEYTLGTVRPTGVTVPWGDSDPAQEAAVPAALAFLAFGDCSYLAMLAQLTGADEIKRLCMLRPLETGEIDWTEVDFTVKEPGAELVNWQRALDQVMIRTDFGKDALSVFFGCHIPCFNGHSHMDPASFDFCAYQKALVIDPGRMTYREGEDRRLFKSAAMHNTLILEEKEPFDYATRWTFENEKNGCILDVTRGEGFVAAQAIHSSYFPTIHSRLLILMEEGFLVIWDRLEHYRGQKVDIFYHLDALNVRQEGSLVYTKEPVSLLIRTTDNLECRLLEGRLSEKVDHSRPTVRVNYTNAGGTAGDTDYLTVLVPFKTDRPVLSGIVIDKEQGEGVFTCNGKKYRILWKEDVCHVETDSPPELPPNA